MGYQKQIDTAHRLIKAKGQSCTITRTTDKEVSTYSEQNFGSLSASGSIFTFTENIGDAVKTGDAIEFREVSTFGNRGPFEVTSVGDNTVTVDDDLTTATDETWYMDVESGGKQETAGHVVTLPPQSVTGQQFQQDFRDGTLQISRALDIMMPAKGLGFEPRPGDKLTAGGDVWTIHGIGALPPDGTDIFYQGIVTRG